MNVEGIERLDARLASLAREETALRLCLGQALEVLGQGAVFELGFSSLAAYALERCDRSVRWAEGARCLARRVSELPALRRAMAAGETSWSMAELVARVARPEDETRWLEAAESRTVRQMRVLVARAVSIQRATNGARVEESAVSALEPAVVCDVFAEEGAHQEGGAREGTVFEDGVCEDGVCEVGAREVGAREVGAREVGEHESGECDADGVTADETCTLTCRVAQEEAWLFEATLLLLERLGVHGGGAQAEALLAEGQGTLLAMLPEGTLDFERLQGLDDAQQRWARELARWRVEAEALCEEQVARLLSSERWQRPGVGGVEGGAQRGRVSRSAVAAAAALGTAALERLGPAELDGKVRALSQALARHELDVSWLSLRFHRAGGWRRLGYATEAQYARERLGLSLSALRGRRSLALRLEKLPRVASALGTGAIGVEAALQVVRAATARTEAAWVERARHRTVKHLREEVTAALVAVRCSGERDCAPPVDSEMAAYHQLEQAVVSGRAWRGRVAPEAEGASGPEANTRASSMHLAEPASEQRRAWCVMLASLAGWLDGGHRMSAGQTMAPGGCSHAGSRNRVSGAGRVALRLRMSRSSYAWWRGLEAQARRWLPLGMSWLEFLCVSMWQAWQHVLETSCAYADVFVRDRFRCLSPVCNRRDVTPHHLRFRSAGGGDEPANIGSICTWCHLWGVHGGRIRATGTAERIHWELGAGGSPCLVVHGRERLAA